MRVGEITQTKDGFVAFYLDQVQIAHTHFTLIISHFKHVSRKPIQLVLPRQKETSICPVTAICHYFKVRGFPPGPLFCYTSRAPIKRNHFVTNLKQCLNFVGLDTNI